VLGPRTPGDLEGEVLLEVETSSGGVGQVGLLELQCCERKRGFFESMVLRFGTNFLPRHRWPVRVEESRATGSR